MIRYVDTSAAVKLLVEESGSAALAADLDASLRSGDTLVSSMLLYTELHCAVTRRAVLDVRAVNDVLARIELVDLEREDLVTAGASSWGLRSADAIHLAAALRVGADDLLTYDAELAEVAVGAGLTVTAPTT